MADALLTADANERRTLLHGGWSEVCAPAGGSTTFCSWGGNMNGVAPNASAWARGPFLLQAADTPAAGALAVHRCIAHNGRHFIAGDAACLGEGKSESVLGFAAAARSSAAPRRLRCCVRSGSDFYHTLDAACEPHDREAAALGFVH